jgi:ubiquinone/menaquinone biosynthesis C-methylase UbiE
MKGRESGMPDEDAWESFFDPDKILAKLRLDPSYQLVVEFGCGYGTFTIPAARRCAGIVHAFDFEPGMVERTRNRAKTEGIANVRADLRDLIAEGTRLKSQSADYVMLFNILHVEQPLTLLAETWRVLRPGGLLGIMHWNYDPSTPRGPSMDIRPKPEQCRQWAVEAGFQAASDTIDLPLYHYGLIFERPLSE